MKKKKDKDKGKTPAHTMTEKGNSPAHIRRNERCKALMAFSRAVQDMNAPKGKSYEAGNKSKIPVALQTQVRENPKLAFKKYYKAGQSLQIVLNQ